MKAVLVFIYRSPAIGDCTNFGISSKVDKAWLLCEGTDEEFVEFLNKKNCQPTLQFRLVRRMLFGKRADYIEPFIKSDGLQMMGGNFAYSSDPGFREVTGSSQPIAIHDRFENQQDL